MTFKEKLQLIGKALKGDEHDYTQGNLKTAIVLLSIPMILELSLESVFALVDIYFVGKLGSAAIAAVGYTESMVTIVYSIGIGLSTAATAIVARRYGEKNYEGAGIAAAQSILVGIFISLVIGVLGYHYAEDLLKLIGADDNVISTGINYTRIIFGLNIFIILLFLINGIFRGAGYAAIAMRSLWLASILNIILDPILIYGIGSWDGYGIEGAAIATCIGRGTGVAYQIKSLYKGGPNFNILAKYFIPQKNILLSIFGLTWPATFQFIVASGSWIILTKLVAETGGTDAAAGYQIAIRNVVFFILPAWGLSNAAATLVGQNLGAKNPERAEKSVYLVLKYNVIFMAIVSLLFLIFPSPIIRFFTDDPNVSNTGIQALRIMGSGFIFYGIGMVFIQSFNGAGDTKTPTWINIVGFWMVQIPLAYTLTNFTDIGLAGIFASIPIAETLIAFIAYFIFKKGAWKLTKV